MPQDEYDIPSALQPLLPWLGWHIALAARLEFALRYIHTCVLGRSSIDQRIGQGKMIREIQAATRQALQVAGSERGVYIGASNVDGWTSRTNAALNLRGELGHALWSQNSDVLPEDMQRSGVSAGAIDRHAPNELFRTQLKHDFTAKATIEDLRKACHEVDRLLENSGRIAKQAKQIRQRLDEVATLDAAQSEP